MQIFATGTAVSGAPDETLVTNVEAASFNPSRNHYSFKTPEPERLKRKIEERFAGANIFHSVTISPNGVVHIRILGELADVIDAIEAKMPDLASELRKVL